jgi:EAL domain-containing protein (putative c-di-GMP-specific phosphodiesterase class I)/GGDEF domain-containing protein
MATTNPIVPSASGGDYRLGNQTSLLRAVYDIIEHRRLTPLFQPIIDMKSGRIIGYEGLIRGPSDSPLHSPTKLLKLARQSGLSHEIEKLCCQVVVEQFVKLQLPGNLFVNFSPAVLMREKSLDNGNLGIIREKGLDPQNVVIEVTDNEPVYEYNLEILLDVAAHYQSLGFKIAIDDLGEDFSNPRMWSELRPEYVKIDRHFIQNIDKDVVKAQFVRSLHEIVANSGCQVIAEGIETHAELILVRDLGAHFGQGYHIARPSENPSPVVSAEAVKSLRAQAPAGGNGDSSPHGIIKLLIKAPCVTPDTPNEVVFKMFEKDEQLHAVVVAKDGAPLGQINRYPLIDRFARPFRHELYGKKPCLKFMDSEPLIVDINISIQDLSRLIAASDRRYLSNGFIITENDLYIGIGTGHDLIREITEMQMRAARYANPLTQLPGNVPINERIDELLRQQATFCACYCDLDNFKPFNDVYGFSQGDEMIKITGKILAECCDPELDFLGHIGGDDFIILFGSTDWEDRCHRALEKFGVAVAPFFSAEDREKGGYITENRHGEKEFHALTTLSIGATRAEPAMFKSHMEISAVAAETKKMAKKIPGNSLYINNRQYPVSLPPRSPTTDWQMQPMKEIVPNGRISMPFHPPPNIVQ